MRTLIFQENNIIKITEVEAKRVEVFTKHMNTVFPKSKLVATINGTLKKRIIKECELAYTKHPELHLLGWWEVAKQDIEYIKKAYDQSITA